MIGGADSVRNNSVWIAVAVTIAGLIVLVMLLTQNGWSTIAAGKPAYASGDLHLDYTLGLRDPRRDRAVVVAVHGRHHAHEQERASRRCCRP